MYSSYRSICSEEYAEAILKCVKLFVSWPETESITCTTGYIGRYMHTKTHRMSQDS